MRSPFFPIVLAAAALAAACGGEVSSGVRHAGEPDPPSAACVGPSPANAMACPGASEGLTADTPRFVVASCGAAKCAWVCLPAHVIVDGRCVPDDRPEPAGRFVDGGDGTVVDALTGLVWLANANCTATLGGVENPQGLLEWDRAVQWAAGLGDGACGLADGSAPGDWRLPTMIELLNLDRHLASATGFEPAFREDVYWSIDHVWAGESQAVRLPGGTQAQTPHRELRAVWPVR